MRKLMLFSCVLLLSLAVVAQTTPAADQPAAEKKHDCCAKMKESGDSCKKSETAGTADAAKAEGCCAKMKDASGVDKAMECCKDGSACCAKMHEKKQAEAATSAQAQSKPKMSCGKDEAGGGCCAQHDKAEHPTVESQHSH